MKLSQVISIISITGLAALILMLNSTSPTEIGPVGVLVFFTTLYVSIFGIFTAIMRLFYRLAFKKDTLKNKDYLYTAILAFGPIMMLMVRSFGAINLWTIGLVIIFLVLAEFLAVKRA